MPIGRISHRASEPPLDPVLTITRKIGLPPINDSTHAPPINGKSRGERKNTISLTNLFKQAL